MQMIKKKNNEKYRISIFQFLFEMHTFIYVARLHIHNHSENLEIEISVLLHSERHTPKSAMTEF